MAEQQQELPAGLQHPGDIGDRLFECLDVFQRETQEHRVERAIAARQRLGSGSGVPGSARRACAHTDLGRGGIETHDVDPERREVAGHLPFAATDVEHPRAPPE